MQTRVANKQDSLLQDVATFDRLDSKRLSKARVKKTAEKLDSISPGNGLRFARDLEHIYNEVLRTEYSPNNAFRLFPTDTSVPEGARKHTVRRIDHQGEVSIYRGGGGNKDFRTSGASAEEQSFNVLTYVTGIRLDFFEQQAERFSATSLRSELELAANTAMRDFANEKIWAGDDDHQLLGVLNYPYVPKTVTSVPFDSSSSADAILAEMHRIAHLADEKTNQTFSPNTWLMPPAQYNYVSTAKRSATTDQTILQAFEQDSATIDQVEKVHELKGRGPNGEDAHFLYKRDDRRSACNCIVKAPTMLPVIEDGLDLVIPMYMQHGGMIMRDPLNNLVVYE